MMVWESTPPFDYIGNLVNIYHSTKLKAVYILGNAFNTFTSTLALSTSGKAPAQPLISHAGSSDQFDTI